MAQPALHGADGHGLAGLIISSGIYDLTTFPQNERYQSYFGEDESLYAARSALPGLTQQTLPLLLMHAELDPPPFVQQAETLTRCAQPSRQSAALPAPRRP